MFHLFASTPALRVGQLPAIIFSVAAHTGLIVMAITPSTTSPSHDHAASDRGPTERVHFVDASSRRPARHVERSRSKSTARGTRSIPLSLNLSEIGPIAVPDVPQLADLDFSSMITDSLDFPSGTLADVIGDMFGRRRADAIDGIYTAESVEKVVAPFKENPRPVYPPSLVSAGIEATFTVRFVVDSTGVIDTKSVEFPQTAHWLFVDAVRRALQRSRYRPAQVDGRPVSQRVMQEFVFRMERGRPR